MNKPLIVRFIAFSLVVILGSTLVSPITAKAETLDQLLRRQAELKQKEEQSRRALEQKKREASNLRDLIGDLDDDISYTANRIGNTEEQIGATNSVINLLIQDIQKQQTELDNLTAKLKGAYVNLYQLSQTSTMELLLQSPNLEEALSQAEYIQAIQTDLQKNIETVNAIKADLEKKKADSESQKSNLEGLKQELDKSKGTLTSQKNQKSYLLNQTQGEQAKYEQLLEQIKKQSAQISNDIYEARLREGGFTNQGGTGGYPWAGSCDRVDNWLFYTCQCTSYAAWKFLQIHGVPFNNTRPGSGSAYNWPALATDQGYKVQYGGTPRVGDAVSWNRPLFPGDQWGHVAIVEAVYSATDIVVSEYNWSPAKKYSQRRINPNNSGAPRYIRP